MGMARDRSNSPLRSDSRTDTSHHWLSQGKTFSRVVDFWYTLVHCRAAGVNFHKEGRHHIGKAPAKIWACETVPLLRGVNQSRGQSVQTLRSRVACRLALAISNWRDSNGSACGPHFFLYLFAQGSRHLIREIGRQRQHHDTVVVIKGKNDRLVVRKMGEHHC